MAETKVKCASAIVQMMMQMQSGQAGLAANPSTPGQAGSSTTPLTNPFLAFFAED